VQFVEGKICFFLEVYDHFLFLFYLRELVLGPNHQLIRYLGETFQQGFLWTRRLSPAELLVYALSHLAHRVVAVQTQITHLSQPVQPRQVPLSLTVAEVLVSEGPLLHRLVLLVQNLSELLGESGWKFNAFPQQ
jgi:hypothetical protein